MERRLRLRVVALSLGFLTVAGTSGVAGASPASGPPTDGVVAFAPVPGNGVPDVVDCDPDEVEDRCEMWTAVYDDPELYDNSLSTSYLDRPTSGDSVSQLAVSPTGDQVFTLGSSCGGSSSATRRCRWVIVSHRASTGDEAWVAQEWADGNLNLTDIAVSADGTRVYATGRFGGQGNPLYDTNVITIAWQTETGQKMWTRVGDGSPVGHRQGEPEVLHSGDAGVAVVADPVGDRVYVTGYSDDRDSFYDVLVIAYDGQTGTRLWTRTYDTSTAASPYVDDQALPRLARISADGTTLYLAVRARPRGESYTYSLVAHQVRDQANPEHEGAQKWVAALSAAPQALAGAPDDSRIYLQASEEIAAYHAATGALAWGPREFPGSPAGLAVSPAGDGVFVAGTGGGNAGGSDYVTVAYEAANGDQRWRANYDALDDNASAVGVSPDGATIYVTGVSAGRAGIPELVFGRQVTVAYDALGELQWFATYSRLFDREGGWQGPALAVGPAGKVFTAGDLTAQPFLSQTKNVSDWGVQAYRP